MRYSTLGIVFANFNANTGVLNTYYCQCLNRQFIVVTVSNLVFVTHHTHYIIFPTLLPIRTHRKSQTQMGDGYTSHVIQLRSLGGNKSVGGVEERSVTEIFTTSSRSNT